MGVTGLIDRDTTIKDKEVESGMTVEIIASRDQCESDILFYGIGTLEPGARTPLHVHDNCEIAWYLKSGKTICVQGSISDEDFAIEECEQGTAGYVAPGEIHMHINQSATEPAVILMAYVGVNNSIDAHGDYVATPSLLADLMAESGI